MRFSLAGSSLPPGRRARRARFPTCGVVRVAGYSVVWDYDPTPIFSLKSTKRSAAAIFGRSDMLPIETMSLSLHAKRSITYDGD